MQGERNAACEHAASTWTTLRSLQARVAIRSTAAGEVELELLIERRLDRFETKLERAAETDLEELPEGVAELPLARDAA